MRKLRSNIPTAPLWCKTPILHLPRAWIIEGSHMCQLVKLDHQLWAWGSLIGPRVAQGLPWWEWEWWGRLSRSRQTVHRAVPHLRATHSGKWNGINRPVASQSTLSIYSSLLWKSVTMLRCPHVCVAHNPGLPLFNINILIQYSTLIFWSNSLKHNKIYVQKFNICPKKNMYCTRYLLPSLD